MLDLVKEVKKVKHYARPLEGVTKRHLGEWLVVEVNMDKVRYKNKSFKELDFIERKALDDLLYLTTVGSGNPKIIYV